MRLIRKKKPEDDLAPSPDLNFDDLQNSFVLLSHFRSGSHMFKLSIAQFLGMASPPEPFNVSSGLDSGYFFDSFIDENGFDPKLMLQDGQTTLFNFITRFFAHQNSGKTPIIDLKYSQSYMLGVNHMSMNPVILEAFTEWKVPIIHLIRRDFVAQAVSHLVAIESGDYLNQRSDNRDADNGQRYWLDPHEVLKNARARKLASQTAIQQLESMEARVMTVFFEDFLSPDWTTHYRKCFRFLDKYADIPEGFNPPTTSQNSAKRVANMEEIVDFITKTDQLLFMGNT